MTTLEPILIIAFNRPHYLKVLLERLREVGPRQLFVAIDGPRSKQDEPLVEECRRLVDEIDWAGAVSTRFQVENLGCGRGVTEAITWFFGEVERGIILEDDIIPDPSFFPFCAELLDRYEDDERILAISGCNHVPAEHLGNPCDPYRFVPFPHIWGWATWRRSWKLHSLDLNFWYRTVAWRKLWSASGRSIPGALFWTGNFEAVRRGLVDTWDYQLVLAGMRADQLTATSNVNLVSNIGFGPHATHTLEGSPGLTPVGAASIPVRPVEVSVDWKAVRWTMGRHFGATYAGTLDRFRKFWVRKRGTK